MIKNYKESKPDCKLSPHILETITSRSFEIYWLAAIIMGNKPKKV